jgi:small subunit ribosomal protein S20
MLNFGFRVVPHCTIRCKTPLYRRHNKSDNHHLKKDTVNVANIKSQIKRILTNEKAHERNKAVKSEVKTAVRATRTAVAAGDKVAAEAALKNATKKLDKAVSKGVLHKNNAANRKSAIAKSVASL